MTPTSREQARRRQHPAEAPVAALDRHGRLMVPIRCYFCLPSFAASVELRRDLRQRLFRRLLLADGKRQFASEHLHEFRRVGEGREIVAFRSSFFSAAKCGIFRQHLGVVEDVGARRRAAGERALLGDVVRLDPFDEGPGGIGIWARLRDGPAPRAVQAAALARLGPGTGAISTLPTTCDFDGSSTAARKKL